MIQLPFEILIIILNQLDPISHIKISKVCKLLYNLSKKYGKYNKLFNEFKENKLNPILILAKHGNIELIKLLINKNKFNKWNDGLQYSIESNNTDCINFFIQNGARKYIKAMNKSIELYGTESKLSKYFYKLVLNSWSGCHYCDTILNSNEKELFNCGITQTNKQFGVLIQCINCGDTTILIQ